MTVASEYDSLSNSFSDTTDKARLLAHTAVTSSTHCHFQAALYAWMTMQCMSRMVYGLVLTSVNLTSVHVAQRSMPEDFMHSHVKVAVADPLDTTASTIWCGAVYQWRTFPQPRSCWVFFSDPMESDSTDLHRSLGRTADA